MENRRQFVRWQVNHAAKVQLEGKQAETGCDVLDISLKGARLALKARLATDKYARMRLILNQDFQLELETWVAWHKMVGSQNIYGLYFSRIRDVDKEKIYKFIRRDFPAHARDRLLHGLAMPLVEQAGADEPQDQDARVFGRFAVRLPLRYLSYDAALDGEAQTSDISAKGVGFRSRQEFPAGMDLEIWIKVSEHGEPFYARARVAWSKKTGENIFQTGVNFEKVDLVGLSHALRAR